jgi:hypothetical protein
VRVGSVLVWAKQPSTAFWYGPFWAEDVGQGGDCQARRTAASSTLPWGKFSLPRRGACRTTGRNWIMIPTLFPVSYAGWWGQHTLDLESFFRKARALGYSAIELVG